MYCNQCKAKVLVSERKAHSCAIQELYVLAKSRLIQLSICQQLCAGCRSTMPGHKVLPPNKVALVFADKKCHDCNKELMRTLFQRWQHTLNQYYRTSRQGKTIISPWHHYRLKIVVDLMKELDATIFSDQYADLLEGLKRAHVSKKHAVSGRFIELN